MPDVPTDLVHWLAALSSIVLLLVLLVGLGWKSTEAGPLGLFLAVIVAMLLFETPLRTVAIGAAKGVWDAVFILYVIWPALLLYVVADRAGAFDGLRAGIRSFSRNELFLVLGFGWVFASFLQGIAGFGVPIAVVAPLLLAIGVRPIYAVAIPLIGHAWANMFGTIAVSWLATNQVIDIADQTSTAWQTAALLWIINLPAGLMIAWLYGRWAAVRHALPLILIISLIHGGGQLALVLWNPVVSNFIAGTVALAALYPLSTWGRYDEAHEEMDRPAMMAGEDEGEEVEQRAKAEREREAHEPVMGLFMALFPYIVLTVVTLGGLLIPTVEEALSAFEIGLPFPATTTGYGVTNEAEDAYSTFELFTHPGTFILVATIIAWIVYRVRGYYEEWARIAQPEGVWEGVADGALPASVAVLSFLIMAAIFEHSGQSQTLALGIAEVAPPLVYAVVANMVGVLGAFMTSSNTASNVLFSGMQQNIALLEDLPESTIIGAQSAGGALGNAIAPANVVLGTGTTGISGREGEVLRVTFPWAIVVSLLIGGGSVLLALMWG